MSGTTPAKPMNHRRNKDAGENIVKPERVCDKSLVQSLVGIIHDFSNAYKNPSTKEEKETIVWLRLFNLAELYTDYLPPDQMDAEVILLMLGYINGIQVWNLNDKGMMSEMLSMRQGPVKSACLLPPPSMKSDLNGDIYSQQRPLMAMSLAADRKQLFTSVSILSLATGKTIYVIEFTTDIEQLYTGTDGTFIVTLVGQIYIYSSLDFSCLCTIKDCISGAKIISNPIAIGSLWLAYSPKKTSAKYQSSGGLHRDNSLSYTATVISAAKTVGKGIATFGDTVNWLAAKSNLTSRDDSAQSTYKNMLTRQNNTEKKDTAKTNQQPNGLVTVLDLSKMFNHPKCKNPLMLTSHENSSPPPEAVVAHFVAYDNEMIVHMKFSPSGMLLATAGKSGHVFNVFTILPHPLGAKHANVQHVYRLNRGDTSARVQEMVFSPDSRWLTVSTQRGTSHLFPITTSGGMASHRTHVSHCLVNRSSRFHKSAGLEEMESFSSLFANRSLSPNGFPSSTKHAQNPRQSIHSVPTTINPVHQIHSGSIMPNQTALTNFTLPTSQPSGTTDKHATIGWQADVIIASLFTTRYLKLSGTESNRDIMSSRLTFDTSSAGEQCMLLMTSDGVMVEYSIRPHAPPHLNKITDDSPIEVSVTAEFRWLLHRLLSWNERNLPLPSNHVMLDIEHKMKTTSQAKETMNGNMHNKLPPRASSTSEEENREDFSPRKFSSESDLFAPKTQQPISQNNKFKRNISAKIPGVAVLQDKRFKTRTMQEKYQSDQDNKLIDVTTDCDKTNGLMCDVIENDCNSQKIEYDKEWLSQVEIVTYEGPARRLWMGPQFTFKTRQSTGSTMQVSSNSSALLSDRSTLIAWRRQHNSSSMSSDDTSPHSTSFNDMYVDDLDLNSLKIQNTRSDPVPTPYTSDDIYGDNSMTMIEAGSGSFGQHGHMLEIGAYGSLEDKRYSSFDSDDKLRERLADAMAEQTINNLAYRKKSGSTSSIEFPPIDDDMAHVTPFEFESNPLEIPTSE